MTRSTKTAKDTTVSTSRAGPAPDPAARLPPAATPDPDRVVYRVTTVTFIPASRVLRPSGGACTTGIDRAWDREGRRCRCHVKRGRIRQVRTEPLPPPKAGPFLRLEMGSLQRSFQRPDVLPAVACVCIPGKRDQLRSYSGRKALVSADGAALC